MLTVVGAAALVLVAGAPWVLPSAAGGENLKPPENIDVYIIDDNYTLKWSSHRESMGNVTFSAEYKMAHISPPGVRLEAEDKAIVVYISPPGQDGNMWAQEKSDFNYTILIWQKSSGDKKTIKPTYYPEKILELLPETTYCLQVKVMHPSLKKHSNYSDVQCVSTTVANKIPVPENLEMDVQGKSYILRWGHASPNVSFRAQWIPPCGYSKSSSGSHSDKWKPIPTCASVRTTHCAFPQDTVHTGTFFLRVQASDGNNTSYWSEEKFIDSQIYTSFPPPAITVSPMRDTLLVYVNCQGISRCDGLTYEIIFWEDTSNTERKVVKGKRPKFTIVNLQPLTVYCVQARVLSTAVQNKTSKFSEKLCKETLPGDSSMIRILTGLGAVFFAVMALYAGWSLLKYLHYVFLPPLKPPPSIDEFFSEPPSKTLLLLTAEEHTERCFVIENTDTVAVEENRAAEEDLRKYSSQTSQDSGNYSNEEEESVGPESDQAVLSTAPCGSPWGTPCPPGILEDGACFLGNEKHRQTPALRTQPALHC
ncbi:Interferon alpha/beta receptor 1 [Apodemus speciosus]|uniref:Interferon alpha/beta receptor 1 n=1 Tax=Apodemus speciosus TaxID=105296 RepID=A0ABQ0FMG0_APOSI